MKIVNSLHIITNTLFPFKEIIVNRINQNTVSTSYMQHIFSYRIIKFKNTTINN